jgi:glycine dehydrogenase
MMQALNELAELEGADSFVARHIGPSGADIAAMVKTIGAASLDDLIGRTVPENIRANAGLELPPAIDEAGILADLRALASKNVVKHSLIGLGYHGTLTPPVILRNVLENPGWYTAYTPYQAEIAQGRLEAILNFQTAVADLTGMEIANASLLDEATAAAEAVAMARALSKSSTRTILVAADVHPQTRAVIATRAWPLGWEIVDFSPGELNAIHAQKAFAVVLNYPGSSGELRDLSPEIAAAQAAGGMAVVCADLLSLTLVRPPGEMGADIVVGSAQRFGVGFGGCRRPSGDAAGAANPRAAYPPREGDFQYLHGAGSARRDGRVLCGVAWAGGAQANRQTGKPASPAVGRGGARFGLFAPARQVF